MSEDSFYIQSRKHGPVGNLILWWGPDNSGYTTDLGKAGVYTRAQIEAKGDYYDNEGTVPVPCSVAKEIAFSAVDTGDLYRAALSNNSQHSLGKETL